MSAEEDPSLPAEPAEPLRPAIRGRGTAENPANRFQRMHVTPDPETAGEPGPATVYLKDATKSVLSFNDSPDVGFRVALNPYRGCEHGCIYCYARPYHEYLGFSAGLDFETKILVKEDAPELLADALASEKWEPEPISISGATDAWQPVEKKLEITRRCLAVLAACRNPVGIVTKNRLVLRDLDLLRELAAHEAVGVYLTLTSLDPEITATLEPRTTRPAGRLEAVRELAAAGIPVGVLVAPVVPGLTDHEIPSILKAAAKAGAQTAGYEVLRLPYGVKDLFARWLERHHPGRREKVLNRIRSLRGGKLNDPNFGSRMRGEGPFAEQIRLLFEAGCRRAGIGRGGIGRGGRALSTAAFRPPARGQLRLFSGI